MIYYLVLNISNYLYTTTNKYFNLYMSIEINIIHLNIITLLKTFGLSHTCMNDVVRRSYFINNIKKKAIFELYNFLYLNENK